MYQWKSARLGCWWYVILKQNLINDRTILMFICWKAGFCYSSNNFNNLFRIQSQEKKINILDWLKLRRDYRIVGGSIGSLPKFSRQENFLGLPLILSPEEVTLLLEKKAIRLVHSSKLLREPTADLKKTYEEYKQKLFAEQNEFLKQQQKLRVRE